MPAPILLLLWIGWGGLLWLGIAQRERPLLVLLIPVADAILWLALVPGLYYFFEWRV